MHSQTIFSEYVSFVHNESTALLKIADTDLGKFSRIELDHVVAIDNTNLLAGIDISATKEVLIHDLS